MAEEKQHYHGHRKRLIERYLTHGPESFYDYELIELLLFFAIPRVDVRPLAKELLNRFGGLTGLLAADVKNLKSIKGIGDSAAVLINLCNHLPLRKTKQEIKEKPVFDHFEKVLSYCQESMVHLQIEQLRVLYLNQKNELLADQIQNEGTINHITLYPREITKQAFELNATALILVHNHPSGDPTPSDYDIDVTKKLQNTLKGVGITLHDHLIVAKDSYSSMRALNLIS